jgi:predicted DNA-binding transcriptional regulator AlpA
VIVPTASEAPTVSVKVAAAALGCSAATAYRSIERGDFPIATVRVGSRVAVVTADLRNVLKLDVAADRRELSALERAVPDGGLRIPRSEAPRLE